MSSAAKRNPLPDRPVSIAVLADKVGISRQRVYNMIKRGEIKAVDLPGGLVIEPPEVARITEAATRVSTMAGDRLVFDFV